jgi:uncharacterized protein YprB with RNaseH-like and TPR domain
MAEFAKIVCISVGYIYRKKETPIFRIKSFYGHQEKDILLEFNDLLNQNFSNKDHYLCAHNGKEFDYPFLCRRMLINNIRLPKILKIAGKKTLGNKTLRHNGTLEIWRLQAFYIN